MKITISTPLAEWKREIRRAVRFAFDQADVNLPNVEAHVRLIGLPSREHAARWETVGLFAGAAYWELPNVAKVSPGTDWLVTLRIPAPDDPATYPFAWTDDRLKRLQPKEVRDWTEGLVFLSAHEARHVRQFITEAPRSETDANEFAGAVLDAWRNA